MSSPPSTRSSRSRIKSARICPERMAVRGGRCAEATTVPGHCSPRTSLPGSRRHSLRRGKRLQKNHGAKAGEVLLDRLRHQLNQHGTLEVLRGGIELVGVKGRIRFAEFKPAFNINPDIVARYQANRLRVVRQVRYSLANENCIDLVLFLNGIPVATVELKTDFTQSIDDAIDQYRYDRHPKPKGSAPEPLLSFPGGALVHFAVSNSEVHMTTRLEGKATTFLPFNKGDQRRQRQPDRPRQWPPHGLPLEGGLGSGGMA